ncbi:hypothetical protein QBC34DRAFT_470206 [Podospora aff. communis PSN243]|uniref:Reverse transcriptase domain-containing protein n=1 Tax=Podospora aff. communis PSN243 TaxID=3040156 RepID=A0AAV9GDB7_9PEZI|nr:hypothetical protein QBC34DRAFT_470206 [Podospora aff. communis PSN243]
MNECTKKQYHPSRFRFAIIIIIKKPGKSSYRKAASWRPIALESCLGKILERVLTNRYNAIVMEHGLLPDTQFSAPGRSCPQALELLRGFVHRARCPGQQLSANTRCVSIMILDMTGWRLHPYHRLHDEAKQLRDRAVADLQPLPNSAPETQEHNSSGWAV